MTTDNRTESASWAVQLALLLIEIKVEGGRIDTNDVDMPTDLDGLMLLLSAATEIGARLVEAFDADPATIIAELRMSALEATVT